MAEDEMYFTSSYTIGSKKGLPHVVVKIEGFVAAGCNKSHCLWLIILVGFVAHSAASYQQFRDSVKTPEMLP